MSGEGGIFAVYVSSFPDGEGKWDVSREYRVWPRWGANNDRLYFFDEHRRIVELDVDLKTTFQPGATLSRIPARTPAGWGVDVERAGQRFLLPRSPGERVSLTGLMVVQGWGRR